ncbi:MAG: response regulator [Candidatus Methylomirabilota bacterium]
MGARILVADDSVTIQKVVELTFSKEDYLLVQAKNGEEAIARAAAERPDLVLLDILMPDKDGYEVCAALRAMPALRDVPVILLTGTFEVFDQAKAAKVGADDFVTKPFESQALIGKVRQFLASGRSAGASSREAAPPPARGIVPELSLAAAGAAAVRSPEPSRPSELSTPSLEISQDQLWQLLETPIPSAAPAELNLDFLEPSPPEPSKPAAPPEVAALDLDSTATAPEAPGAVETTLAELSLEMELPGSPSLDLTEIQPPAERPTEPAAEFSPTLDLSLDILEPAAAAGEEILPEMAPLDLDTAPADLETPERPERTSPPPAQADADHLADLSLDDLLSGAQADAPSAPFAATEEGLESVFDLTASAEAPLPMVEAGTGEPPSLSMDELLGPMQTVVGSPGGEDAGLSLSDLELLSAETPLEEGGPPVGGDLGMPEAGLGLDLDLADISETPAVSEPEFAPAVPLQAAAGPDEALLEPALPPQPETEVAEEKTPDLDLTPSIPAALLASAFPAVSMPPAAMPVQEPSPRPPTGIPAGADLAGMREAVTERVARELTEKLVARIEQVVWEVVPDLAEVLITQEIERIRRMAEEQKSA